MRTRSRVAVLLPTLLLCLHVAPAGAAQYGGPLYDTHTHADEWDTTDRMGDAMGGHDVRNAVVFFGMDPDDPDGSFDDAQEVLWRHPERFVLFFHVDPKRPSDSDPARLEKVLASEHAPLFSGFGESAFYRDPWRSHLLSEEPWPGVLELAAREELVVMVHVRGDQSGDLERALAEHPDTTLLVHGPELLPDLPRLLAEHDNLLFTLDASTYLREPAEPGVERPRTPLMFPPVEGDAAARSWFLETHDRELDRMMEDAVREWTPVVAAAPDRVFWGTDVAFAWHTDDAVYGRILDFSRDFIAALPAETRDAYAFDNARQRFGVGVTVEEPEDERDIPAPLAVLAVLPVLLAALAVAALRRH